jgi:RNA 2',3'-cyclic 3'-phosphodiesterase
MEQIRTFIAIELPEKVKQSLIKIENDLKAGCPSAIKWVNPGNIHLTLKFLGNIEVRQIEPVLRTIQESVRGTGPFSLKITELGVFPNLKNIQVVWLGLDGDIKTLLEIQKRLETKLVPLGFPLERRPFTAHLTLARVSDYASEAEKQTLSNVISKSNLKTDVSFQVISVSFMKSQLARTGAVYTRLHSIEIKSSCQ